MLASDHISLNIDLAQIITTEQAWHYHIIPKEAANNHLVFYVDEKKYDKALKDELEILFGKDIQLEKVVSDRC